MKCISLALILTLIFASVIGCSQKTNNHPTAETTQPPTVTNVYIEQFYDREKQHRPTVAELQSIKLGMPITEVFEILGKPHARLEFNVLTLEWESTDGKPYIVQFWVEEDAPQDISRFEQEMLHSFVVTEAEQWPPETDSTTEQPTHTEPTDPNFP